MIAAILLLAYGVLEAPAQIAPAPGKVLYDSPAFVDFKWSRVEGAESYELEVDCLDCCEPGKWCSEFQRTSVLENLKEPRYWFPFNGEHPGRWRVWAVAGSRESEKSSWRNFSFQPLPHVSPPNDGATWTKPAVITMKHTELPESAQRDRVRGTVVLNVMVGADGTTKEVTVFESLREDVDQAAIASIKTWAFKPATRDGKPVAFPVTVTVSFRQS